ncbi:hypothetical protein RLW55_00905 [Hyphomicrobium sp. B1]|uniref:hypothetical protein n=1 Tax=unclassified Hyphomicrobium TaxID=2619925 RepID=UPI00391C4E74
MAPITNIRPIPYPKSVNGEYVRVLLTATSLMPNDANFRHALRFIRDVYGEPTVFHAAGNFHDPDFRTQRFWARAETVGNDEMEYDPDGMNDLDDRGWLLPDDPLTACAHLWDFARPHVLLAVQGSLFTRYLAFRATEGDIPIVTITRYRPSTVERILGGDIVTPD